MAKIITPKEPEAVKKTALSKLREDYNALAADFKKMTNWDILVCPKCGLPKNADTGFYLDRSYATSRYPVCKQCIQMEVEQKNNDRDESHETKESVKAVLQKMDRMWDEDFYDECVKNALDATGEKVRSSPFSTYITAIQSLPQYRGKTWSDSTFSDVTDSSDSNINENSLMIKKAKKRFGKEYSLDDLMFLETEYEDWCNRYECNQKAQEKIFENLSFNQLATKKARLQNKPTDKLVKEFQDLMNTGNITPKQTGMDGIADSKVFGTMIEDWEEHDPLPETDPELADVDKIGLYIDTFYRGHESKLLGLDNKYADLYEKVMKKYTVERNLDEDTGTEETFRKIFGEADI